MPEYLDNPRKSVRAPLRCRALVLRASGATETATEDIGARGCQLVLPDPPVRGDDLGLAISLQRHPRTLRLSARVAWVSPRPPWRLGVAFSPEALPEAARWMETLIALDPRALDFRRSPERVPLDATVYLGLPPGAVADFTDDELLVLRTVGLGLPVRVVRDRLTAGWPRMHRAIFSLLTRQSLTLARASSSHPRVWRQLLGSDEPSLERLSEAALAARMMPSRRADRPAATPTPRSVPVAAPPPRIAAPPPLPSLPRQPPSSADFGPEDGRAGRVGSAPHRPDFAGAGVGWRDSTRPRSAEAQALFNHGLAELELERPADALNYLRRALALAPGDADIAKAIGRALSQTMGRV